MKTDSNFKLEKNEFYTGHNFYESANLSLVDRLSQFCEILMNSV